MISWFRRHQKAFFVGIIVIFLLGTFVGLGGYLLNRSDYGETVAVVGKTKIPTLRYQARVNQYLDALRASGRDAGEDALREVKMGMLREMVVDELLAQQAEAMGLRVTDGELASQIMSAPRFQRNGAFDQALYFQTVRAALRTTPEDYERQQRRALLSAKLKQIVYNGAKVLPSELREEYLRAKKPAKDFEKDKEAFSRDLQQERALSAINFYLRLLTSPGANQVEVRTFLDQREQG